MSETILDQIEDYIERHKWSLSTLGFHISKSLISLPREIMDERYSIYSCSSFSENRVRTIFGSLSNRTYIRNSDRPISELMGRYPLHSIVSQNRLKADLRSNLIDAKRAFLLQW